MESSPDRLRLGYDLLDGSAGRTIELPFVLGVMADFSGEPREPLPPLHDRHFDRVTPAAIDRLLRTVSPRIVYRRPTGEDVRSSMETELVFDQFEDFNDVGVRRKLLAAGVDGSDLDQAVAAVLTHPVFGRLRATWMGLANLNDLAARTEGVQLLALNVSKTELAKNLRKYKGLYWDSSPVFRELYDNRLKAHGGLPIGSLIGCYEFDHTPRDLEALTLITQIAENARCPFIASLAPRVVHARAWSDLPSHADIPSLLRVPEYEGWLAWRREAGSAYVTLVAASGHAHERPEDVVAIDSVFGLGRAMVEAFGRTGTWRDLGTGIACLAPQADAGLPSTSGASRLEALGALSLSAGASPTSTQAVETLALSLLRSRFDHHIAAFVRDKAGPDSDADDMRRQVQNYLMQFVDGNASDTPPVTHPLKAIDVRASGSGQTIRVHCRLTLAGEPGSDDRLPASRGLRTRLSYDVEAYGSEQQVELPFVLAVLGDFSAASSGLLPPLDERRLLSVDRENLDGRVAGIKPRLSLHIRPGDAAGELLTVDLTFSRLEDFTAAGLARLLPHLEPALESRQLLSALLEYVTWADAGEATTRQFIGRIRDGRMNETTGATSEAAGAAAQDFGVLTTAAVETISAALQRIAELHTLGRLPPEAESARDSIRQTIQTLDEEISASVDAVLHHADFQRLERTWLGLRWLLGDVDTEMVRVCLLDVSEGEFRSALRDNRTTPLPAHPLFRLLHRERSLFLSEPVSCIIGDYSFDHNDCDILSEAGRIGEGTLCPFVLGARPALLGLDGWLELGTPRSLDKITETPEYEPWRRLRHADCARFVVLALPRLLGRRPYRTSGHGNEDLAWLNASFGVGRVLLTAFGEYGWPGRIAGVESGGTISPVLADASADLFADLGLSGPTETAVGGRRVGELHRLGLTPLVERRGENAATFFEIPTLRRPDSAPAEGMFTEEMADDAVRRNLLRYVLMECRVAQSAMALCRDRVGAFRSIDELSSRVAEWLASYVDGSPEDSSQYVRAARPLAATEVVIAQSEPTGEKRLAIYIRPHYQIRPLSCSTSIALDIWPAWLGAPTP